MAPPGGDVQGTSAHLIAGTVPSQTMHQGIKQRQGQVDDHPNAARSLIQLLFSHLSLYLLCTATLCIRGTFLDFLGRVFLYISSSCCTVACSLSPTSTPKVGGAYDFILFDAQPETFNHHILTTITTARCRANHLMSVCEYWAAEDTSK